MVKTPKELYQERLKRIDDAIHMRVPDKVPVTINMGYLPASYVGMTFEEAHYNCDKWIMANRKIMLDLKPDMLGGFPLESGVALETIDPKIIKWPGHGIPPNSTLQWVEDEYMKADEYDDYLADPTDFAIRTLLPRMSGRFATFEKLGPLINIIHLSRAGGPLMMFVDPEFMAVFEAIRVAAQETERWVKAWKAFVKEMEEAGFPGSDKMGGHVPFDYISDYLRGMKGTMLDMYRQPDKLLEAIERLTPILINSATNQEKTEGLNMVGIALHAGADGFMSLKQFEKFYWPGLKALIMAFVDKGFIPSVFFEGHYDSRLEYLLELPKGKVVCRFDRTDMFKVKEVLGGHQCISGGVLASLLHSGSVHDVKGYCKKLIEIVGKDGGYIMSSSSSLDDAKPENVKAMIDSTIEFNRYK